jgi:hypothetical protein
MTPARADHVALALRAIAVAIAIAAIVDPAVKLSGAGRPRVAIVAEQPASPAADRVRARLLRSLGGTHEILSQLTSDAAAAIVIGDRYPDGPVPAGLLVATVTTTAGTPPAARLVGLAAPAAVPAGTAIRVEADIEASGLAGRSSDVTVSIGGLEVGRMSHRSTSNRERWHASLDVVPVGDPPWIVRADVTPANDREAGGASVADVAVGLRREPLAVLIYEPRPSWATTFVRRALESDARFRVESTSFISRGIAARTPGSVALADSQLDSFDAIVAGGLERLSAADARALDRFMRERGGAVALIPDARVDAGPVRDLMPFATTERLLERPERLATRFGAPPFDASELLVLRPWIFGANGEVVASAGDGSPVVVSLPHGRGRLFASGAMDAWRYRASAGRAFDRFWQAAVAALALAAPPPVEVTVSPPVLRPLERADVLVRLRSDAGAALSASADGEPIRLWPEPEAGRYRGAFTARSTPGRMSIETSAAGDRPYTVSSEVIVQEGVEARTGTRAPLALLAWSHRGIDVTPERINELEGFVRASAIAADVDAVRRPMRSPWWLLFFAASLSGEWWVRRGRGHR